MAETTDTPVREALLPCPFCGNADVQLYMRADGLLTVTCNDCGGEGPGTNGNETQAARYWNDRSPLSSQALPPVDADEVERVTKAILFEDSGSTEGWEDNTRLGRAAIVAMSARGVEPLRVALMAVRNLSDPSSYQEIGIRYACERIHEIASKALAALAHAQADAASLPLVDERMREGLAWGEVREWVRSVAMSLPPSDFGSGRAVTAMTDAIMARFGATKPSGQVEREAIIEECAKVADKSCRNWKDHARLAKNEPARMACEDRAVSASVIAKGIRALAALSTQVQPAAPRPADEALQSLADQAQDLGMGYATRDRCDG